MNELPYTAEYGSKVYADNKGKVTTLCAAMGVKFTKTEYSLQHKVAGYYVAGSCGRYDNESWELCTMQMMAHATVDGSTHKLRRKPCIQN